MPEITPDGLHFTGHKRAPDKDHIIHLKHAEYGEKLRRFARQVQAPPSWDSRKLGIIGPIKDQGQCGSCHDDKTEVLTEKGWTKWENYDWTTALATMNLQSGSLEFQPCLKQHVYDHDGPMYYAEHASLDFALTGEHGMYVSPRKSRYRPGSPLLRRTTIESLPTYCELPATTRGWLGTELEKVSVGNWHFSGDDFLAFISLVISDGNVRRDSQGNTVTFCCFREDRIDAVRELAYKLGIKEQESRPGVWNIYDKTLSIWFHQNCYDQGGYIAPFKRIPTLVKCASKRQIEHFLKFFGDQSLQGGTVRKFYTCSRGMAGDLQELLLRIGKRSSCTEMPPRTGERVNTRGKAIIGRHPEFSINENSRNIVLGKEDLRKDHYKGKVFCATVPNGTLITRRNGKLLISSNCWDFSGTCVVEVALYKAGVLKADGSQNLSEQYTLSCGRNGGCGGDDNVTVLKWAEQTGLPLTSDYGGYEARADRCNYKSGMPLYKIDSWGFADSGGGSGVTPVDQIKAAIMQYGCVGCAVDAGFRDPGTGVISGSGHNIDHDVALVGWDDSKGSKGAWIMRNSWGCYDDATEILTDKGWVLFKDLSDNDSVATLNPNTHCLEYQSIQARQEYDYDGELTHYTAQGVDLMVTPNHKIYSGGHMKPQRRAWRLEESQRIRFPYFRMKKDAYWLVPDTKFYRVGNKVVPMDVWLEFLGYFVSEGYSRKQVVERPARVVLQSTGKGRGISYRDESVDVQYIIGISQCKECNIDVIQKCIDKLPWKFHLGKNNTWTTNSKELWMELSPLGKSYQKYLPHYFRNLSRRQCNILLDALMLGDGTRSVQEVYYTSSPRLADDVQELALRAGFAADIGSTNRVGRDISNERGKNVTRYIEYRVSLKKTRVEPCPNKGWRPEQVDYKGKVYCVTVPNHIVYVRRNGKAVWSGNSSWADKGYAWIEYGAYDIGTESVWAFVKPVAPPRPPWYM